jgi:dihydroorotate dehydrogenase
VVAPRPTEALATFAFGLRFPSPLGLAAGLDKNARLLPVWQRLGFGFVEIGTVTPRPQAGNPRPRLFRLPADHALINRMGFNNEGVEVVAARLARRPSGLVVGANIGKNRDTANADAAADYLTCFRRLRELADYFVVNVSSPNTPGLRALQDREPLSALLSALQEENQRGRSRPLLLKVAPDLSAEQLGDVIAVTKETGLSGVVATNTTLARSGLRTARAEVDAIGAGGLSGEPLGPRARQVVQTLATAGLTTIGVGGILSGTDALAMRTAGAALVQVYSGLIYRGPALVPEILAALGSAG